MVGFAGSRLKFAFLTGLELRRLEQLDVFPLSLGVRPEHKMVRYSRDPGVDSLRLSPSRIVATLY